MEQRHAMAMEKQSLQHSLETFKEKYSDAQEKVEKLILDEIDIYSLASKVRRATLEYS